MNLAIISPRKEAYSQSFIDAHVDRIRSDRTFIYHGGFLPQMLDGKRLFDVYHSTSILARFRRKILGSGFISIQDMLARSFQENEIDVILAEYGTTGANIIESAKKAGIPVVVHFHGFDASMYKVLEEYKERYLKMFEYASNMIAVSKVMKKGLIDMGCPEDKIVLAPYGPSPDFFEVDQSEREKKAVALGRFVDKKAPYLTVLAFARFVNDHPEWTLMMGGDGELLSCCKGLARALNVEDKVSFPGPLDRAGVQRFFTNASMFVQHSVRPESGDMEGTPVAVLEAGASALPVVATKHAGIPDVIIDGETGYLVDEFDVDGMVAAMCRTADMGSDGVDQMGRKGRIRVKEEFSMEKHIGTLQTVLEEAIS